MMSRRLPTILCAAILLAACSSSSNDGSGAAPPAPTTTPPADDAGAPLSDAEQRATAVQSMHDVLLADVQNLASAAVELQAAAPAPAGRGWDETLDATSLAATQAAWVKARTAYERIEGALAPLFPDLDVSIDARYDDFLTDLIGQGGDAYLFDDKGVTGMHAIERILYADVTPPAVVTFESKLEGYVPAAMPATETEASDFKNKLATKLVTDTATLLAEWTPAKIDAEIAYSGLVSLVAEQREKVVKASTSEEESRYSQRTMTDLRDNLAGTKNVYAIFQPWIQSKTDGGPALDADILKGFAALDTAYGLVSGEAIPQPPATWSAETPSAADLATPFGQLYESVTDQVDPASPTSVTSKLDDAGKLLGFASTGQ